MSTAQQVAAIFISAAETFNKLAEYILKTNMSFEEGEQICESWTEEDTDMLKNAIKSFTEVLQILCDRVKSRPENAGAFLESKNKKMKKEQKEDWTEGRKKEGKEEREEGQKEEVEESTQKDESLRCERRSVDVPDAFFPEECSYLSGVEASDDEKPQVATHTSLCE